MVLRPRKAKRNRTHDRGVKGKALYRLSHLGWLHSIQGSQNQFRRRNLIEWNYVFLRYFSTACLLSACYGCVIGWIAPIQTSLESDRSPVGRLTEYQLAWLASIPFLAAMTAGIFIFGPISSRVGRKTIAYVYAAIYLLSNVAVYLTSSYVLMLSARFVVGACIPGTLSTVTLYISEICDPSVRGNVGCGVIVFCNSGIIIMFLAHSTLSYDGYNLVLVAVPALFIALFWMMPESPVFYLKTNRLEDCQRSLIWLQATKNENVLTAKVDKLREMFFSQEIGHHSLSWKEVFSTPYYRKALFLGVALQGTVITCGIMPIETYAYTIFSHCLDGKHPGHYPTYMMLFNCAAGVVSIFIMHLFSRRFAAITTRLGAVALLFTLGGLLLVKDELNYSIPFIYFLVGFLACFLFFGMGFSSIAFIILGELFSVECRDKFMEALMQLRFLLQTFYVMIYPITVMKIHIYSWMFIYGGVTLVLTIYLMLCLPETSDKSIAEIAEVMTERNFLMNSKMVLVKNMATANEASEIGEFTNTPENP